MGDRRISDLTAQTSFASGDCLAVDNSGNTESKKITAANAITTPINNVSQKVSGSTDAYSSSKAYSVGDLVIYNNTVYECTTACSAASWSVNQSNFTATTLSSKLTSLNQALSNIADFSLTEKVIGKWVDGRTLYKKTINFGTLPNSTSKSVAHGISNLSYVVSLSGVAYSSSLNRFDTLPYFASTTSFGYTLNCDKTNVTVSTGTDRTSFTTTYITIIYVKTT